MTHTDTRTALLHLAADQRDISNTTLKRSLDLLAFLEIEELEVAELSSDEWGGVMLKFADARLPRLAVSGYDVTAMSDDTEDAVAKLVNAITCAYEADDLTEDDGEDE